MHKLRYYQTKFGNQPTQGTAEWLLGRTFSFGGSEMSILTNQNKYCTWNQLKSRKQNLTYEMHDNTEFGNLFEPIAKYFIEKDFGKIYEFGAIPSTQYPICYSPDGLIVDGDDLALLEIKCPIMRGVKKIPVEYLDQVKVGMCILNVKYTLFCNFRFRRCSMKTKPWTAHYDRGYHKEFRKREPDIKPIAYGYIYWNIDCDLIDLASQDNMIQCILSKLNGKSVRPEVYICKSFEATKGIVMMFKLFEKSYCCIKPDPTYLAKNETMLWNKYKEMINDIPRELSESCEEPCDTAEVDNTLHKKLEALEQQFTFKSCTITQEAS